MDDRVNYRISNGFIGKLVGILSTSALPEFEREALLEKIPLLYQVEAQELYDMLMNNQLCATTQLAQYSYKGVQERLDKVMENEKM